jgi:DNA-directed RNA polymerase specialized sigma24 family protein
VSLGKVEDQVERSAMLDGFRRREAGAVRAMYREYGRLVYSVAHHTLGRHDLAEDVVQQTFLNAWRAADRIDIDRDPAPWLADDRETRRHRQLPARAAPARNRAGRRRRRRPVVGRRTARPRGARRGMAGPNAIGALVPEEATIVRMQHLEGMTQVEISEQLGIALGTVKSRSHRAHRRLAEMLGHLRSSREPASRGVG